MSSSADSSSNTLRTLALILLPVLGIVLVVVAIFATRAKEKSTVAVVVTEGQAGLDVNVGTIIDATDGNASLLPQMGYRYKVFVDDESDDRSSGIAKIGRLVTFVPGARRGQTAIVDVTRVRERVADAILVTVLSEVALPPKAPRPTFVPLPGDSAGHVIPGAEMDVVISEASEKNPTTEGVAKVAGLVVFVNGATTIGERVNVRIVERRERVAMAMPTGKPAGTDPLPEIAAPARPPRPAYVPGPGDSAPHVVPGAVVALTIVEPSDKNPTTEGVAKIDGFVVFVKGATVPGQAVNVRITDRRRSIAMGEVTTDPVTAAPAPVMPVETTPIAAPVAAPVAAPAAPEAVAPVVEAIPEPAAEAPVAEPAPAVVPAAAPVVAPAPAVVPAAPAPVVAPVAAPAPAPVAAPAAP